MSSSSLKGPQNHAKPKWQRIWVKLKVYPYLSGPQVFAIQCSSSLIEETIFLESYLNIAADGLFLFSSFYSKVCWRVSFGQSLFLITPIFDKNLPGLRRQKRKGAEKSKCKLPKSLKSLKYIKTFETLLPKISAMDVFKFWLLGEMAVYETFKESQEEGNVIHKKMFCV